MIDLFSIFVHCSLSQELVIHQKFDKYTNRLTGHDDVQNLK